MIALGSIGGIRGRSNQDWGDVIEFMVVKQKRLNTSRGYPFEKE
jgi:hypothetical protein